LKSLFLSFILLKILNPLTQIHAEEVIKLSSGRSDIVIGIIDGPVDLTHEAFVNINIQERKNNIQCCNTKTHSIACNHGTFITGILAGKRGLDIQSLCPSCKYIIRPVFLENTTPMTTIEQLAEAIIETVDKGANVINLSLGIPNVITPQKILEEACVYARNHNTIIVVAAGNQQRLGGSLMFTNEWIIPVTACDQANKILFLSNLGIHIGKYGIMAPGVNIKSTLPGNTYGYMTVTSVATTFATGIIALLWSLYPKSSSSELIYSIRNNSQKKSVIPDLLNGEKALNKLKNLKSNK
jgi:subtilisin family serine protease